MLPFIGSDDARISLGKLYYRVWGYWAWVQSIKTQHGITSSSVAVLCYKALIIEITFIRCELRLPYRLLHEQTDRESAAYDYAGNEDSHTVHYNPPKQPVRGFAHSWRRGFAHSWRDPRQEKPPWARWICRIGLPLQQRYASGDLHHLTRGRERVQGNRTGVVFQCMPVRWGASSTPLVNSGQKMADHFVLAFAA